MSIDANHTVDPGFHTATAGSGQILAHALNAGVDSFQYAAPSGVSGILGGNALFLGADQTTRWAGFDPIAGDGIVVLTDSNILDFSSSFDNARWFLNPAEVSTGAISVPEPSTISLLGLGLLGVVVSRRRTARR